MVWSQQGVDYDLLAFTFWTTKHSWECLCPCPLGQSNFNKILIMLLQNCLHLLSNHTSNCCTNPTDGHKPAEHAATQQQQQQINTAAAESRTARLFPSTVPRRPFYCDTLTVEFSAPAVKQWRHCCFRKSAKDNGLHAHYVEWVNLVATLLQPWKKVYLFVYIFIEISIFIILCSYMHTYIVMYIISLHWYLY